jgi:hypothetical protein
MQEEGWRDRGRGSGEEQEGHYHRLGRGHGESESQAGHPTLAGNSKLKLASCQNR